MERALTLSSMPLGLYTCIGTALHAAMCLGVQAAIEGHAAMVQLLIDAGGCSVCIT